MPKPIKYTADELERRLSHEINMLNGSYALISTIDELLTETASDLEKAVALNAIREDFCIHARLLVEFFLEGQPNSASGFASGYSQPEEPSNDLVQKLNDQIARFTQGRTQVEPDKIADSDRTDLLRWIDAELKRWLPLRDGGYANIPLPSVDLTLIGRTGPTIRGGASPTKTIRSLGPVEHLSGPASLAPSQSPSTRAQIRRRILTIWISAAVFVALVFLYRFYVGDN